MRGSGEYIAGTYARYARPSIPLVNHLDGLVSNKEPPLEHRAVTYKGAKGPVVRGWKPYWLAGG